MMRSTNLLCNFICGWSETFIIFYARQIVPKPLVYSFRAVTAGPHDGDRNWRHLHHLWLCKQDTL